MRLRTPRVKNMHRNTHVLHSTRLPDAYYATAGPLVLHLLRIGAAACVVVTVHLARGMLRNLQKTTT